MSSSSGRNRERKPARRRPFREPKPKMLIVCEGAVTEKEYFEQFARRYRNSLVDVVVKGGRGDPHSVVEAAKKLREAAIAEAYKRNDDFLNYQSVWCVFDVDSHPNPKGAKKMAVENGLNVAVSNPCFELWLLLHFSDCPGPLHRDTAQNILKTHISDYDKSVNINDYIHGYNKAVRGAESLDRLAESIGEPGRNPTTGVYKLTESIRPHRVDRGADPAPI